jgi:acid stress-induced BolA-like protein IbaG/YrbA
MPEITFKYAEISLRVKQALLQEFSDAGIFLSEGYGGRVHVKIISAKFADRSPSDRQAYVYDVLRAKLDADSQAVTLVTAVSPDDL